ncbi:MAG: S1C family serine protease, partial [Duncaniella sp.]|nr:S1C family serine protease [Duncaniella sp.]
PAPGELLPMSYASGTISAVRAEEKKLQINAPITHGFSGGALVNEYGEVVGISSSGYDNNNANLNFAVDINVVRDRLDQLNLPYAGK